MTLKVPFTMFHYTPLLFKSSFPYTLSRSSHLLNDNRTPGYCDVSIFETARSNGSIHRLYVKQKRLRRTTNDRGRGQCRIIEGFF